MVKWVLKDWAFVRNEAWKRAWKNKGFYVFMFVCMMSYFLSSYGEANIKEDVAVVCQLLVVAVMLFFHYMYPNRLPKPMMLVPLDEKEKRSYLWTGFCMKLIIVTFIHGIGNTFLVLWGGMSGIGACLSGGSMFLWNFIVGMNHNPVEQMSELETLTWMVSLFNYIVFFGIGTEPMEFWEIIVMLGLCSIQLGLGFAVIKRKFPSFIEEATDYEKTYVIERKKTEHEV